MVTTPTAPEAATGGPRDQQGPAPGDPSPRPSAGTVAERLAAGVAHQINNVLTVVAGHASVLLEVLPDPHPTRASLEAMLDASVSGAGLAEQLLSFSSHRPVAPEPVHISRLWTQIEKRVRTAAGPNLEVEFAPPEPSPAIRAGLEPLARGLEHAAHFARALFLHGGGQLAYAVEAVGEETLTLLVRVTGEEAMNVDPNRLLEPYAPDSGVGKPDGMRAPAMAGSIRQAGGSIHATIRGTSIEFRIELPLDR